MSEEPRFSVRKGLGSRRGWDIRLGDEEDADDIRTLAKIENVYVDGLLGQNDVTWHIIESSIDEHLLGFVATRVTNRVATIEALGGNDLEIKKALLACAENTASCTGAYACRASSEVVQLFGYQKSTEENGFWTKTLKSSSPPVTKQCEWPDSSKEIAPPLPPPVALIEEKQETNKKSTNPELCIDDLGAQLELVSSIQALTADFVQGLPDTSPTDQLTTRDDESSLEDLVGSLLKTLKTDKGKAEFNRLAQSQQDQANARRAPRTFVPRPQPTDSEDPATTTTTTVGDARAFAELLAADVSFQAIIRNHKSLGEHEKHN